MKDYKVNSNVMELKPIKLLLAAIVIIAVGFAIVQYMSKNRTENTLNELDTKITQEKSDLEKMFGEEEEGNEITYTVTASDSLWKIAQKELGDGNKWVEIAKANDIKNPNIIRAGQELRIGKPEEKGQITAEAASTSVEEEKTEEKEKPTISDVNASDLKEYTVQKGDSLWAIAKSILGDGNKWTEIAQVNKLVHPSLIHSGNVLQLPS